MLFKSTLGRTWRRTFRIHHKHAASRRLRRVVFVILYGFHLHRALEDCIDAVRLVFDKLLNGIFPPYVRHLATEFLAERALEGQERARMVSPECELQLLRS